MFCPECGKKNKDEAKFCEYCGTKIEDNSPKEFKPVNKEKVDKKTKIIISIITGILIVLISSFMVISNNYKPTTIAKNYFEALMSNDSDRLYKYLSVKNSGLTSKKIYKEVTSNKKSTLKEYEITNSQISSDGQRASVIFSYTTADSIRPLTKTIYLEKGNKKLLFFDNWEISDTGTTLLSNYQLKTFKDANVKLNGIDLKKYKKSGTKYYDLYEIPEIFKGTYDAKITLKNGLSSKQKLEVSSYSATITNFKIDDKNKEKLTNQITNDLNKIYLSAINNKSFEDIKEDFKDSNANLEKAYNSFTSYIKYSDLKDYSVKTVNILNLYINSDGNLSITADINYNYTVKKILSDEEISKKSKDTVYLTYDYSKEFKLVNMTGLDTYFSRR